MSNIFINLQSEEVVTSALSPRGPGAYNQTNDHTSALEESELFLGFFSVSDIVFYPFTVGIGIGLLGLVFLLGASALISGSEVAFFSLSPVENRQLEKKDSSASRIVCRLLDNQERLLATIVVANNFVNVAIVILSTIITELLIDFSDSPTLGFVFKVVVITFLLLLFGEILPKLYANHNPLRFTLFMGYPLFFTEKVLKPVSMILVRSGALIYRRVTRRKENLSIDDLSHALDITSPSLTEDRKILKGIVDFGNKDVTEIMKPRIDVIAVDTSTGMNKLILIIIESGYSRIPVFSETFDDVRGILYVKDLLPHHQKDDSFRWQTLIRPPYFVPETKKINDLLKEFQTQKIHMAVVVDEYGGTTGIVTMEDILEEIVGEISDEFDLEELYFSKLDDRTYIFEGKTPLNDFYKILNLSHDVFDEIKGEADTLAGLILEYEGEIPEKNKKIIYKQFEFKIESADTRRIKQIRVCLHK
ncbi:MAG: gliding motility-associated protein GldE [Bacteroidales bacterium]